MKPESMPDELIALENRLCARNADEPSDSLCDRVLRATQVAMSEPSPTAGPWEDGQWAAVAAGILLVLNLSMITASQTEFSVRPAPGPNPAAAELQAIRQLESQQEGNFK